MEAIKQPSKAVILFILLNVLDVYLTSLALSLGSSELNPVMKLGALPLMKSVLVVLAILLLWRLDKFYLLKYLNIGMSIVVVYNLVAIWSWL